MYAQINWLYFVDGKHQHIDLVTETRCVWHYRHLGSPPAEASSLPNDPELAASDCLLMQPMRQSAQNDATGMLDNSDVEPSDLTIIASPTSLDQNVDTTVEQTCEKIDLTVGNVRSIIRVSIYIVTFNLDYWFIWLIITCCYHKLWDQPCC